MRQLIALTAATVWLAACSTAPTARRLATDAVDAMGGAGTMAKWYNGKPRLVSADFLHPNPTGAAKVGALLEEALLKDYGRWKAARGIAAGAP